jgi:FMN phosphatase YigB (HAD superfamily)
MISALLFDLDDTLLGNRLDTFVPAYFDLLARHFPVTAPPEQFLAALAGGTRAMLANTDPARTLRDVFNRRFEAALGAPPDSASQLFEAFYARHFPQLQSLTTPLPAARAVMEWAFVAGYQVVIATAPLFPLSAIRERLRWAGLHHFPYARITHIDNSRFAKPRPEYFAETLAALGLQPHEALLIGNDWVNDVTPAAAVGLPHYWIAPAGSAPPADAQLNQLHPVGIGDLEMFLAWAQSALPTFNPPPAPSTALPYLLTGQLAAAVGALDGLPASAWAARLTDGEWSLTEIVCHLRDVEAEVHLPRLRRLMEADNPFISGADTDPWAVERGYQSQSGPQALRDFIAARQETVAYLRTLSDGAWNRPARHAIFGPTYLAEIVGWMLGHDRIHLEQLAATRARLSA